MKVEVHINVDGERHPIVIPMPDAERRGVDGRQAETAADVIGQSVARTLSGVIKSGDVRSQVFVGGEGRDTDHFCRGTRVSRSDSYTDPDID